MEQEEAALQEEGGLTDMIDSLKAKAADAEPTPEDPSLEAEAVPEDENDAQADDTFLSID